MVARAAVAAAFAATLFAISAFAQDYPSKPIRILVPAQAGGIGDILPRILGQKLGDAGSATIVVENRTAGAGVVAAEAVARAERDGTLLLMGNQGQLAIRPHLAKLPYDPIKDFDPVILMVTVPNILVVHPSVPAKTLAELIAYAKANPGKLSYASQGLGASGHVAGELFKQAAGVDITHVPYRGAAPAAQDLAAGHVSMMFDVVSLALGPIRSGTVRALGVAAKERVAVLADVPTMAEGGHDIEVGAWFGLLAPAGTPRPIVDWLNRESNKHLSSLDARERFVAQGAAMPLGTPEVFRDFIAAQSARFAEVIRRAGIKEQ
jgi:tripartite-type tricarboxylate transporter receptor subunit TctC